MGRISEDLLTNLKERLDIVEVVSSYIKLKKMGSNLSACCPFHQEKSPSFTVSPQKQFYHCFGCGAHGDAISFVQSYENIGFMDAVEKLAAQVGIVIEAEKDVYSGLYSALAMAQDFFESNLRGNQQAIDYLKSRGLDGKIAKHYGIGYANDSWDDLKKHLQKNRISQEDIAKAGLITEKGYDRFRGRVMFPIRSSSGKVIAFGGRAMDNQVKYLNSPETPVFHKSDCLYGVFEQRGKFDRALPQVVVEGYMDVVGLAQFGFFNAVATLGTAVTESHIHKLLKTHKHIVLAFDGDSAGKKAAYRALKTILPVLTGPIDIRFLTLPMGHDPDSLVRSEGIETFKQMVSSALPLSEYVIWLSKEIYPEDTIEAKARRTTFVGKVVAAMPDGDYKRIFQQERYRRMYNTTQPKPVYNKKPKVLELTEQLAIMLSIEPALASAVEDSVPAIVSKICEKAQRTGLNLSEELKNSDCAASFTKLTEAARVTEFNLVIQKMATQDTSARLDKLLKKAKVAPLTAQEKEFVKLSLASKQS